MSRFVQRDGDGRIQGSFANLQPGYAEEEVADDDAELVAFLDRLDRGPGERANYRAMIRRRAQAMAEDGDEVGALLLLKSAIGE